MSDKREMSRELEGSDLMGFARPRPEQTVARSEGDVPKRIATAKFDKDKAELAPSAARKPE